MTSVPRAKHILCCYNPACKSHQTVGGSMAKAPLKCTACKTARYCNVNCQRQHWSAHKEFCAVWAKSTLTSSGGTVLDIKKSITHFFLTLRSLSRYTELMFKRVKESREDEDEETNNWSRAFVEFEFENGQQLLDAIKLIETLPYTDVATFYPAPFCSTYREVNGSPVGQKIPQRHILPKHQQQFTDLVDSKFEIADDPTRHNLQLLLDMAENNEDVLVVCVTVLLDESHATHSYDFFYRGSMGWAPPSGPSGMHAKSFALEPGMRGLAITDGYEAIASKGDAGKSTHATKASKEPLPSEAREQKDTGGSGDSGLKDMIVNVDSKLEATKPVAPRKPKAKAKAKRAADAQVWGVD